MVSSEELNGLTDWTAGIAERKIQDAIDEGLLDNLPGKGKPLDLSVNPFEPPGMGAINRLLKHNKVLPLWVMLEQDIETSRAVALATLERWEASVPHLRETPDYARARASARESYHALMRHTNDLILKYNCSSPFALRAPIPLMIKTRLREFDERYGVDGETNSMNVVGLEQFGAALGVVFAARIWSKWRVSVRQRRALTTPLVDAVLLESVFAPRPKDGDDANLLAEMRDTFLHLNRQAYAEEFWGLHTQLVELYGKLGPPQQSTLRRALVRLVTANDRWLQLVGAKTSAALGVTEAVNPLRALLEMGNSQRFNRDKTEYTNGETVDLRYRDELEKSLATLTDEQGKMAPT